MKGSSRSLQPWGRGGDQRECGSAVEGPMAKCAEHKGCHTRSLPRALCSSRYPQSLAYDRNRKLPRKIILYVPRDGSTVSSHFMLPICKLTADPVIMWTGTLGLV